MDISDLRKEYLLKDLHENNLLMDPIAQFQLWLEEAIHCKITEPNAMALATCNSEGIPSCRLVLLKHFDQEGFIFFTNLESRKARELNANPYAAATFWWGELERQVRIEGKVEKAAREQAAAYFSKRPRNSQLGAWASRQSTVIPSRTVLEEQLHKYEEEFKDREIPLPHFWGGYKIIPSSIEFWQGRENRLSDRLIYILKDQSWEIKRLSP